MKIGILKEGKNPPDKRVPFSPKQCSHILESYPGISIFIQPSDNRCFSDLEYLECGVTLEEDLSNCDVLMGIKEVPIDMLIKEKIFLFFSHTIKKQPYNKKLLQNIIKNRIQLIDYETLLDVNGKRVIGFGRYAGIVGCYNTFLAYGKKTKKYHLEFANLLKDKTYLERELSKVVLPDNLKIILTGTGRVSSGAVEVLELLGVKNISKKDFLNKEFNYPTYVQLTPMDYNDRIDGYSSSKKDFYTSPHQYQSSILKYALCADILITGHYFAPNSPVILSRSDFRHELFKIKVVGDISCDINGPIGCTLRPSTINNPIYGYNPVNELEDDYTRDNIIAVMAVDNLPCSLPKDASVDFGQVFISKVLDQLHLNGSMISKATIAIDGSLTDKFSYLSDYIS
tara:strand:- start:2560 stop:3753 length:1194 start_codon:yes stop_codon:yes gene_type:complete